MDVYQFLYRVKQKTKRASRKSRKGLMDALWFVCQLKFDKLLNLFYDPDIIRIGDENEKETADRY